MRYYYLCVGSDNLETESVRCSTLRDAVLNYREVADELGRYDQRVEASVHIAPNRYEITEYPDYVLSVGPRGGIRCDRA